MIDHLTISRIMEAADIYDVVSEFVSLKKAGANYKGLCPFHNDRTPSFFVSRARGYCKCFSCGKGGNAVGFIMEHEQLSYLDALRYLARKYNIEIKERELTEEEKREQTERESMFIVNEWAANYFEDKLLNSEDGATVGMAYFRSRGFRDDIIRKFKLGYDPSDRRLLAQTAISKGYNAEYVEKTGLCYKTDRGELIDRFAGRVIFPWFGISGKVVGFGGRLLDARTKGVAQKYVNSPESDIYHKDQELYGIYQARKSIARENRVYMVEGYTDVISMHQCGIENVVANSGTALSMKQISILHRLTSNITLLYDGDEAGIHAAMRGTDMILSQGMNIKVLLLPDGDDPDSFARKHTAEEFKDYIEKHQTDFIDFKCSLLLNGVTDPIKRAEAIDNVLQSVAKVKDPITRSMYFSICKERFQVKEEVLMRRVNSIIGNNKEEERRAEERENRRLQTEKDQAELSTLTSQPSPLNSQLSTLTSQKSLTKKQELEEMIMQLIISHGETTLPTNPPMALAQFVTANLSEDDLSFSFPIYNKMLNEALEEIAKNKDFCAEQYFMRHENLEINQIATRSLMEIDNTLPDGNLSEEALAERLLQDTNHLLIDLRLQIITEMVNEAKERLTKAKGEEMAEAMKEYQSLRQTQNYISRLVGRYK